LLIDNILKQNILFSDMEIIIVDDFSNDITDKIMQKYENMKNILYIKNEARSGQSKSISNGIKKSKYTNIITIDGDGQNDPSDFSILVNHYNSDQYCLVSGIRKFRKDNFVKIFSSKVANFVRSLILNDHCQDSACGLKLFSKDIFLKINFFDGMHRFLPALFIAYGVKPVYVNINHKPRIKGISKYGTADRLIRGLLDLHKVKKMINKIKISNDRTS
ncbi:glycosyltransferase, partial [Alphaproteobacteria bacterium]|nr:glycosyltransferase [Alphaproteobacteria bacterium]